MQGGRKGNKRVGDEGEVGRENHVASTKYR